MGYGRGGRGGGWGGRRRRGILLWCIGLGGRCEVWLRLRGGLDGLCSEKWGVSHDNFEGSRAYVEYILYEKG